MQSINVAYKHTYIILNIQNTCILAAMFAPICTEYGTYVDPT